LHETSTELDIYITTIVDAEKFIRLTMAKNSEPWTKFLLDGVPTYMALEDIQADVEEWNPKIKLGQTP
jgi:hypothetical protein